MVGEKYINAVLHGSNGLPMLVPALGSDLGLEDVLDSVHGLLLTGSPSNVEPQHYGGEPSRPGTMHDPERDQTTLPMISAALDAGLPVLAVCRGFQEMNVALGGTLHQNVHEVPGYAMHKENPEDSLDVQYGPSHRVKLIEGGLLRQLAGSDVAEVNSLHAQGVAKLADGVTVEAVAEDGLIEAFRVDGVPGFALAVQWHPEWKVTEDPFSMAIFGAFGDASREYAARRRQP